MKILMITVFLSVYFTFNVFAQKNFPYRVIVDWESFSTETIADISCDQFDYSFFDTRKTKVVAKKPKLKMLNKLIRKSLFSRELKFKSFDVRGKITVQYANKTVRYCFDQFGHFGNDDYIYNNKLLWKYITELIDKGDQ